MNWKGKEKSGIFITFTIIPVSISLNGKKWSNQTLTNSSITSAQHMLQYIFLLLLLLDSLVIVIKIEGDIK